MAWISVGPPCPQLTGKVAEALPTSGSLSRSKPMTVELPAKVCAIVSPEFAVHRHTAGIDKTFQKVRLVAQVYVS